MMTRSELTGGTSRELVCAIKHIGGVSWFYFEGLLDSGPREEVILQRRHYVFLCVHWWGGRACSFEGQLSIMSHTVETPEKNKQMELEPDALHFLSLANAVERSLMPQVVNNSRGKCFRGLFSFR